MTLRQEAGQRPPAALAVGKRQWAWIPLAVLAYVVALGWIDREIGLLDIASQHGPVILVCLLPVSLSFVLRYQRWRFLLGLQGTRPPWGSGLLAYLSGFALTISPGKAGELLRIRYHQPFGVSAPVVIRSFVCERVVDLLVLLGLALWAAEQFPFFHWIAGFVALALGALILLALVGEPRRAFRRWLQPRRDRPAMGMILALVEASDALRLLADFRSAAVCVALGLLAWLSTSATFVLLCTALEVHLAPALAWGLYPLAMLIGAASGVPGGVGTTEAAIVLLLSGVGQPLPVAMAVAVLCRGVTLWFAVIVGLGSMAIAERLREVSKPDRSARIR